MTLGPTLAACARIPLSLSAVRPATALAPTEPWYRALLDPGLVWAIIAILGLLCWTTTSIVNAHHRHRERLAMIERGIHPDRDEPPRS